MTVSEIYLVAGTARTGSNLLCHALAAAGVPRAEEAFSRATIQDSGLRFSDGSHKEDVIRYLKWFTSRSQDARCGIKIFWHQVAGFRLEEILEDLLAGRLGHKKVKMIFLRRRDTELQAVSTLRSYATGEFASRRDREEARYLYDDAFWATPGGVASARERMSKGDLYDFDDLDRIERHIKESNTAWLRFFQRTGTEYLAFYYEDLADDFAGTANSTIDWIGFDGALPEDYLPLHLVQRDEESYRLAARFRKEKREKGVQDGRP
jgi:LPS sulfotransferase NodH